MTIYSTPYDKPTGMTTGPSTNSGFTSIDECVNMMGGGYIYRNKRMVIYGELMGPRVCFSDFKFRSG